MRDVIDAEFEVIRGPAPDVEAPAPQSGGGIEPLKLIFGGFLCLVAAFTALLAIGGADIDTRDAVKADAARQPVPYEMP